MKSHVLGPALAVALLTGAATIPASVAQPRWQTYVDAEFGSRITYPAHLFPDVTEIPNGVRLSGADAVIEHFQRQRSVVARGAD